jgi:hypothetical protein
VSDNIALIFFPSRARSWTSKRIFENGRDVDTARALWAKLIAQSETITPSEYATELPSVRRSTLGISTAATKDSGRAVAKPEFSDSPCRNAGSGSGQR